MDLFTLVARLSLDASDYEKGVQSSKQSFMGLANTVSAKTVAVGTMIAHGVERAAGALLDFGKNAIQASADIEAEISLYQQVFGELESAATGALESISQDTNILSTRLRGIGTSAFMQFKGAGVDAGNALAMMDKYTRLAADAAAAYNISIEEADQKLRSFIRGNTEAGDSINLFTSESQRNERALATYKKKWTELTEAQKQMLMLGVVEEIYTQTEIIGQAGREAHSWTTVIGNLNESLEKFSATVGDSSRKALIPIIEKISDFLGDDTVLMRIGMLTTSIVSLAEPAFDGAINLIDALLKWSNGEDPGDGFQIIKDVFSIIGNTAEAAYNGAKAVVDAVLGLMDSDAGPLEQAGEFFKDLKTLTESEGFQTAVSVLTGILAIFLALNSPILLVGAALALIVTHWQDIKEWANKAYEAFKQFIDTHVPEGFMSGVTSVINGISDIVSTIYSTWTAFIDSLSSGEAQKGIANVQSAMNEGGIGGAVSTAVEQSWWWKGIQKLKNPKGASFATGLDYVPNDNFAANLHEGEAVLTKAEAADWRRGGSVQAIDYAAMGSAVGSAVREALSGIGLYTDDGTRIADMVTQRVSRNIAREAKNRRFAPVV